MLFFFFAIENYRSLKGDTPAKWERIFSVEIIGAISIFYELIYLIDYSGLDSDSVSPL